MIDSLTSSTGTAVPAWTLMLTVGRPVYKQASARFFRVRLWTQKELLEALFANSDTLEEDLKAELPLKRIWTVAAQDAE